MKKLLIAAAIVCAAVMSQAASTDWKLTCGNMKDHTGADFTGTYQLYATGGDLASAMLVFEDTNATKTFSQKVFTVSNGLTPDQQYNFYYVLTDSSGAKLTSETKGPVTALGTGSAAIGFGNQATYTGNKDNWSAVPEPTSGLLLLLGVAGLALKRRRADVADLTR